MKFTPTDLPGVVLVEPQVFKDERGFFFESYHQKRFRENGLPEIFVQDNNSWSRRGVIRGLHFQKNPFAQGKLVRVLQGAIFDVAVDIRPESPHFKRWIGVRLDTENRHLLYIPMGFAHGFCALEEGTEVAYKVTEVYSPSHEQGVLWDDPEIGVVWPKLGIEPVVSAKDRALPRLRDL